MARSERIRSHAERSAIGKRKKESVIQRQELNGALATRFCSILALTMPAVLDLAENSHRPTRRRQGDVDERADLGQISHRARQVRIRRRWIRRTGRIW